MKYESTRGGVHGRTFEDVLFSGYAADGGIFLPECLPSVSADQLRDWVGLSYRDLVKQIVPMFVAEEEIPSDQLNDLLDRAFRRFDLPSVVQVARLRDRLDIVELWHGPTNSFKDLALCCVGQFMEYFLSKRRKHVSILVGTSGDTGSAAIESVRGSEWADIVVLLPRDRCAKVQELQMTTVLDDNVHIFRVDGTSDDLDEPLKAVFMDAEFVKTHNICSINSINWARIMVQVAHYFYTYFQKCPSCDQPVEIVVPTGACGNVTAGLLAREMGLPVTLVCAVNVNDIVARTVSQGDFSKAPCVRPTLAPAMDIQVPYNMERIFYILTKGDTRQVAALMEEMESKGQIQVPEPIHSKLKAVVSECVVNDNGIREAMVRCWTDNNYLLCPHTAIAAKYHYDHNSEGNTLRACLATASSAKFEEAVCSAGLTPRPTAAVTRLASLPTKYVDMEQGDDWQKILRQTLENITLKRTR